MRRLAKIRVRMAVLAALVDKEVVMTARHCPELAEKKMLEHKSRYAKQRLG